MSMRFSPLYHIKIEPRLCIPIAKLQVKLQNFRKLFQIHCPIFLISTLIARQIKPKEIQTCGCIQTWRCIAKTLNQLSCIASAVTECCRIQLRAICKFLSWCQSKLKQSHGAKWCWQKKKNQALCCLQCQSPSLPLHHAIAGGSAPHSFLVQASPEVEIIWTTRSCYTPALSEIVL